MSGTRVDPSGFHLKRELTALRKARYLRDPETSSSWRSPLSSRSVAAISNWNHGDGTRGNANRTNASFGFFEPESSLPPRSEKNRKKVFLYNWRQHSGKSSDGGLKLGREHSGKSSDGGSKLGRDNRLGSFMGSPEDSLSDSRKGDSKSDTYLENPRMVFRIRETNSETLTRKMGRKLKKSAISEQRYIRNSTISKQLDLPCSSLGAVNSVEQSDDTEYCNSEDLQLPTCKLTRATGYNSCSASPLLSVYENRSHSSKILNSSRREDSSYSHTPASASSYNRSGYRYTSTVESWDGTTASFDGDEMDQLDLSRRQGCGIPCYLSKRTTTQRGCRGCYSPSLSDTLRRKGSSIFCGGQTLCHKRRSLASHKQKKIPKSSHSLPLLTNSCDGGGSSVGTASDELSTNFRELDLEASNRLDRKRWSSCRSQDGLELALTVGGSEVTEEHRSLSQKYRPRSFDELVGQNIVVHSLNNAILRGKIAPFYLFQGPRGTGKKSMARIFSAALNCLSTEETKPCGFCRACTDFTSGKSMDVTEVDSNKKRIDKVRYLLKNLYMAPTLSCYKIFIINECHMLPSKAWSSFLKFLKQPPLRVVIIFVTTDQDSLPRTVVSQCRKYLFLKIKDADIVSRLKKLSAEENLDVEVDALDLIALNSDGSLLDAEMMLDQLSLLGKRITTSLVNDLVGVVSDEKLLDLLEFAMSSETAETVKRARELMDSGVDPLALMSQLAGLIMDIIAGTYQLVDSKYSASVLGWRSLTDAELERLKKALKILSEAEKQLRLSCESSTWFTAALLQLGSRHSTDTYSSSNSKQGHKKMKEDASDTATETSAIVKKSDGSHVRHKSSSPSMLASDNGHSSPFGEPSPSMSMMDHLSFDAFPSCIQFVESDALAGSHNNIVFGKRLFGSMSTEKLDEIWRMCIERCHSKTLRQLLCTHGKLISISQGKGVLIAYIAFGAEDIKSRAERFLSSITNSLEVVLRYNVEVKLGLLPDWEDLINGIKSSELPVSKLGKEMEMFGLKGNEVKGDYNKLNGSPDQNLPKESVKLPRKSFNDTEGKLQRTQDSSDGSLVLHENFEMASLRVFPEEENIEVSSTQEERQEVPTQSTHVAIDEQRLESAWLQATEKGTPGSVTRLKPERNQVLPQDGICHQNQMESMLALAISSKHWEDEQNREIKALKVNDNQSHQDKSSKRVDHYAMSPSLLHSNSFVAKFDKENLGYESGPSCNGLLCWKTSKPPYRGKVKQGTRARSHKPGRFLWFGQCGKSKAIDNRHRS
ncbi:protein STICHEL-like [Tasmannia lanceolata]|uniref:protein STICHEL-like n=1 Tax=Tasmannia lanceolata TaxID=3420 RepID=UPI004062D892